MSVLYGDAAPPDPLVGLQLGTYRLDRRLGGGVMALVYRGVDRRNGRAVAVKVLLPNADPVLRSRFRQEGRTHRRLAHPNIVPILDVGEAPASGLTYLVMELIEGPNLGDVLEEYGRLGSAEAARLLAPIARALDYSHRQGVIHRDVKPSNILLRRAPGAPLTSDVASVLGAPVVPLLSDFGIARALDAPDLTSAGRTIGTPTYMSPEQSADSHELDGRSDLYSLGAVFFRCIVGRPPFGGTTTQILHAHVYDPLVVPQEILAGLPPLAVQVLQNTLAKNPSDRYARGELLAADFERLGGVDHSKVSDFGGDVTATLPAVAAVQPAAPRMEVLVPGVTPGRPAEGATVQTGGYIPPQAAASPPVMPVASPARPHRRWAGAVLGLGLLLGVLAVGWLAVVTLLPPGLVVQPPAALASTPTPRPAVSPIPSATPAPGTTVAEGEPVSGTGTTPGFTSGTATRDADAGADTTPERTVAVAQEPLSTATATATREATTPPVGTSAAGSAGQGDGVTPDLLPTPAGSIQDYWEDGVAAYEERDWASALNYFTLVRRIDPAFQRSPLAGMLLDIRLGLAAEAVVAGDLTAARGHLAEATALRPDDEEVRRLLAMVGALENPSGFTDPTAPQTLQRTLAALAEGFAAGGNYCSAVEQLQAATAVLPNLEILERLREYGVACVQLRAEATAQAQLASLSGRILYSTQVGERYQVLVAPARAEASSTLVIDDASQPARQRRGSLIAFHSRRSGDTGIWLFDPATAGGPDGRARRVTGAPEDALDAPPSWAPDDRELAYSSTRVGDRRPRIFVTGADGGDDADRGLGRDPAWSPVQDRIVYNDVGAQPGLWSMMADGADRVQLTDNGNDIRPAWSPDGKFVVFMSQRDGNWELYRLGMSDGSILRLTDDPAQDGLPTVSPDGAWVAFASDRAGYWRVWVVPMAGGEAYPLYPLEGVLVNWLEHALQWIL
jgi:serine/threonine-protein kinase